jgi:drug/metabolite transporter (DMT)-like permease
MASIGVVLALASAIVWGAGDFTGGFATRRGHQFEVLTLSSLSGVVLLLIFALLSRETLPPLASAGWAAAGGISGAVGLACLYRGLSLGSSATVAPIAAVITAALPVVFTGVTAGWPRGTQLAGFGLAMLGIWLVARASTGDPISGHGLRLAIVAGAAFGLFLITIAQVQAGFVFVPLAIARAITLLTALFLLLAKRLPMPPLGSNRFALLAGFLDAGGNVLYLLAREYTRLDVAAVLASLYPVTTVVLARIVLEEQIAATQWAGGLVCVAAVVLITI